MPTAPDDPQTILKYQLIPWWERYGLERLAISESTIQRFQKQSLPPAMHVSVKRRQGEKVHPRGPRRFNNVSILAEAFPEDAQDTCRHPILYFVVKGRADLHIADYLVHCPAGHFVLMRPGVSQPDGKRPHLEGANREGYCEVMHFSLLPGAACVGFWICCSEKEKHWARFGGSINRPDAVNQFHFFMREILEQPAGYEKTASNSLHNFFLLLLRELEAGFLQPTLGSSTAKTLDVGENAMDYARQYMESHLHEHLTSAKVAEAVFMSRSNFLRHFTRATGQSFNQYLTALRLQKAREYLADNTFSIQAVSSRVGIQPAQLYRIFKTYLGMSPSEFQQLKKVKQND